VENLSDIEALALRCRSDESKSYIAEAIRCYRASAYRAAIVNTWIAIVFDLVDKVRELALSGDVVAKDLETKYETYIAQIEQGNAQGIKSALEFERNILDLCKEKLQFFDSHQFVDLVRLREDRHRCAHPSFQRAGVPYKPSAEQARLHIRNAIVHVLSQPPVQGKAALAELKTLVSSAYFPDEKDKAISQLQTSALRNASDALVRGFVDQLIFGFVNDQDPLFYKPQAIAALNAAYELYPAIVEERLAKQLNKAIRDVPDHRVPGAACLVAFVSPAWGVAEQVSRDKIAEFVTDGPVDDVLGALGPLSKFDDLKLAIEARINSFSFAELSKAINSKGIGSLGKGRALHFLSEVSSWNRANEVFSEVILPLFAELDRNDISRIIKMPTEANADLPGSHGYHLFIGKVRESGLFEEDELNQLLVENLAGYLVPQQET
jgi:hypothetical protein